jgi:hypothetical protein
MNTPLSGKVLLIYLDMLDNKSIHYRAELAVNREDENALHNLKLLERYAVEAMARPQAPRGGETI